MWAHVFYLLMAIGTTYFFTQHPVLSVYTLQLVAVLILAYFGVHFIYRKQGAEMRTLGLDLVILTVIVLLLVTQTGGLASPLMFTVYLLLFVVGLLFEVPVTLALTVALGFYFVILPSTELGNLLQLSELVALLLMTPVALWIAHLHEENVRDKWHIAREETEVLTFLSLELKPFLLRALDELSFVIPRVPRPFQDDLKKVYQGMRELWRKAGQLQGDVDRETDS